MKQQDRELVEGLLDAFMAKDLETAVGCFAEDALFYDPHYPEPEMRGQETIRGALGYVFAMIDKPGFHIRHFWSDGRAGALEVDTHHLFRDGSEVRFPQTFVFETDGKNLTRLQAYVPYPPPGNGANEGAQ